MNQRTAVRDWLKTYTWIQKDGSVDFSRGRVRPKGLPLHAKEVETIEEAEGRSIS